MAVTVENAGEGKVVLGPDDIETCSGICAQVDIGHQLEVFIPMAGYQTDCFKLFGCPYLIWIGLSATTTTIHRLVSHNENAWNVLPCKPRIVVTIVNSPNTFIATCSPV